MPSALRSIIRHVWTLARRAADTTTSVDTFSEFQLRDIGLTRDNDSIRARAGDVAVAWRHAQETNPRDVAPLRATDHDAAPPPVAVPPSPLKKENKDINISLCD